MGNFVSSRHSTDAMLDLGNGGMSVLISVLVFAGSELARTEWEERFVSWLARHDQAVFGLGMVGFDLAQIPWTEAWESERAFFGRVIALAREGFRYDELGYDPPFVKANLATLRSLVDSVDRAVATAEVHAFEDPHEPVPRCADHGVIAHAFGCALCGDDVPPTVRVG